MPYGKQQAKAVLANTSGTNPRHRKARQAREDGYGDEKKRGQRHDAELREIASPGWDLLSP